MAGELDVDEAILRRLTAKQFRGWEMYHELEPFGEVRADFRAASIVQMLYNVNRGPKQQALPMSDFLLKFDADPVVKPKQDQFAVFKLLAAIHADMPPQPSIVEAAQDAELTAEMHAQLARARAAVIRES